MASSFSFLKDTYPELFVTCELSERLINIDPSSSITKARLFAEKLTTLIQQFEELVDSEETQVVKIDSLYRKDCVPLVIKEVLHTIRRSGNKAAHRGSSTHGEALFIIKQCYRLAKWFYETYEDIELDTQEYHLSKEKEEKKVSELEAELKRLSNKLTDYQQKIQNLNSSVETRSSRKIRSVRSANNINLDESETRLVLIDPQLRLAGWECDTETLNYKRNKTMPQKGHNMAIAEWKCGKTWADYALFIGTTLYGLVESKKFSIDISTTLDESKGYAKEVTQLEDTELLGKWGNYNAPFLFSTNGRNYLKQLETKSGVWFLDIRNSRTHARALSGWQSPEGLVELYKRDLATANEQLQNESADYLSSASGLSLRDYQLDAIQKVEAKIINNPLDRRALLVMATGTGKTRTAIGLVHRLIKSNRFKRVLFLTDRTLLVNQALDDFKDKRVENLHTFAEIYQIEGLQEAFPEAETRLHFATVQSLVKRLFYANEEVLSVDAYDCIIVDEAHRGYNLDREIDDEDLDFKDQNDYVSQYKRVIEYFDAHIIGLTATPALHTTQIFGEPVHTYSYREAVIDGYLVDHQPPFLIKTKLGEEGILWEKGEKPQAFNPETGEIEELEMLEDELLIEIEQFNKKVITPDFNRTVIKELVNHLDPSGDEKTLIFAARDSHADMIVAMLKEEFNNAGIEFDDDAIQKITGSADDPESQTKHYKNERNPNIAVTVDLLTTGVDVPRICNLVFLRRVRSRILFEQMIGRATRLCDDIGKEYFQIFDAVRVYEALEDYTQMKTVSNPSFTFDELVNELSLIDSPERKKRQLEQIIAKLQRRRNKITGDQLDQFARLSQTDNPSDFIDNLKNLPPEEIQTALEGYTELWKFLDERIFKVNKQLYSEHKDELLGVERGYGDAEKPEDYINGFKEYIQTNRNSIMAINTICTKPSELDRKSLKELKLILDQDGYTEANLNTAWKNAKNENIAADIIAYIRTLALDTTLVPPQQRVRNAIAKVRAMRTWTKIQDNWIKRFEDQLLVETVLRKEDLDKEPFKRDGGFKRIDKQFDHHLDEVLEVINENLYRA